MTAGEKVTWNEIEPGEPIKEFYPGGFVEGGMITTPGPVAGSTVTTTTAFSSSHKKPTVSKVVPAPTKPPRKLLVAFLGEDDEVEWCAKVHPRDMHLNYNLNELAPLMQLEFYLVEAD